jgi:hypothetical protein
MLHACGLTLKIRVNLAAVLAQPSPTHIGCCQFDRQLLAVQDDLAKSRFLDTLI